MVMVHFLIIIPLLHFLFFFFYYFIVVTAVSRELPTLNDDILGLIVFKSGLNDPHSGLSSWTEDDNEPCAWKGVRCDPKTKRVVELALDSLSLSGNVDSRSLQTLRSLKTLSLSGNNFSGPIPPDFFSQCAFSPLRSLSLAGNRFSGEIPANVGSCSTLTAMNLSFNALSGSLPSGLWSLTAMRSLDLSENSFSGEIPAGLRRMRALRTLILRGNKFSGWFPDEIGSCFLLKTVDLERNAFTGSFPSSIRDLPMLRFLSLRSNSFYGKIPWWVGRVKKLETLDLAGNFFDRSLPENLTADGGVHLSDADFSRNLLIGGLPAWVFELGLRRVSFAENKLNGTLETMIPAVQSNLLFLNLSHNFFSGSLTASIFAGMKSIEVLDLSDNQFAGSIPPEIATAASLISLELQDNELTGPLPSSLTSLGALRTIDLSGNKLSGTLPEELSNLPNLISFNISDNFFSGDLPSSDFFKNLPESSTAGNPSLCGSVVGRLCPVVLPKPIVLNPNSSSNSRSNKNGPENLIQHNEKKKIVLSISALIALGAAALIAVGVVSITVVNLRVQSLSSNNSTFLPGHHEEDESLTGSPTTTTTDSISGNKLSGTAGTAVTAILNKDSEIGRGGFGVVYKAKLRDGRPVAIKKLATTIMVKSREEFERVAKKLQATCRRHPNLVDLRGFHWTPTLQLLIYEFVPGGNLYNHLHHENTLLCWKNRLNILVGVARGLAYLHSLDIIHYNVKSSNVLIDGGSGEPKLSDFGLVAMLMSATERRNAVLGSGGGKIQSGIGYMAPEFACREVKITDKCDVYSFGVMAMEVLTGRRPVEYSDDDVEVLCDVVRAAAEGVGVGFAKEMSKVDGERLEAGEALKVALACTCQLPSNRPDMSQVVTMLERLI